MTHVEPLARFNRLLALVQYKDGWSIRAHAMKGGGCYLQCRFEAKCSLTGKLEMQHARKWLLSGHMTDSEVIRTAFMAVLAAEKHEAEEAFRYRGERVFTPHLDVDATAEAFQRGELKVSVRPPMPENPL